MSDCCIPPYVVHDQGDIQTLSQIYPQHIQELNIPKLWNKTKGKGITVAILDTGIQLHSDLVKNIDVSKCRSFISDEDIFDMHVFHSVHVAGIVGAIDNSHGIVGVAPDATLVGVKVLDKTGRSRDDSILKGLEYCLTLKPDIINMSLGGTSPMPECHEVIKKLTKNGTIVVCSVGNNAETNNKVLYPAQYDECIAVGAYSNSLLKDRALFSSYGPTVDLLAPGEKIFSTYNNNSYAVLSGSSMAAPFVSGVVALILSFYKKQGKTIGVEDVKKLLYSTTIDIQKTGLDDHSGWGIIHPEKILSNLEGIPYKKPSLWKRILNWFK